MKKISIPKIAFSCLALALLVPSWAMAASLEPPAAPSDAASGGYTTDDVYNRLQSGAVGAKRTGGFTEPSAGPADDATKTMDEIMAAAPAPNDSTGLKPSEAPSGKPFWGLNQAAGGWGPQTGSNANIIDTTEATAPASAADISTGKKAFVNGTPITGTKSGGGGGGYSCPAPGILNGTRWCAKGNGTVQDMTTGLVWLQNANCTATLNGVVKSDGYLTWDNARIWSAALVSGQCDLADGSTEGDWRLPTKNELKSLANGTEYVSVDNPKLFSGVQLSAYWSSSTYVGDPTHAWIENHYNVYVNYYAKTGDCNVWPVRGGQ